MWSKSELVARAMHNVTCENICRPGASKYVCNKLSDNNIIIHYMFQRMTMFSVHTFITH